MLGVISGALFVFTQCTTGYKEPIGSIYTSVGMNKDVATKTDVGGRTGESCATGILGLISTGDASVKAAAAQGNIGTINSVDYHKDAILGSAYVKMCTRVNGN